MYFWEILRFYCVHLPTALSWIQRSSKPLNCIVSTLEMAYFKNLFLFLRHLRIFFLHNSGSVILHLHGTKSCLFCPWVGYNFKIKAQEKATKNTPPPKKKSGLVFVACFPFRRGCSWASLVIRFQLCPQTSVPGCWKQPGSCQILTHSWSWEALTAQSLNHGK